MNKVPPERRRGLKKFGLRKCLKCKVVFKLDGNNFYANHSRGSGGYDWFCKICHKEKNKKYYRDTFLKNRFDFLRKFKFTCQYCGRKAPEVVFHIDHVVPRSKGGSNNITNLTLSCDDCNIGKGNRKI